MQQRTSMTATDDRSDTDLLLAYGRDGDEAAFPALAGRHVDMIFAVSLRRSGNRQSAEEATQNVLVSLSTKARKLSAQAILADQQLAAFDQRANKGRQSQVESLAPVLGQGQQQRYHEHLVSKRLLPMFGIKLPAPAPK